jgi:predicted amidohydrolase
MSPLRVAAAQAVSVAGDVRANVAAAARLTSQAADQGARLVLLPEAFLTGYDLAAFAGPLPSADDLDGAWLDPLRAAAADRDWVLPGACQGGG